MASTSRGLDCSLDQLIDQSVGQKSVGHQRRREFIGAAPSRAMRRVIETVDSPKAAIQQQSRKAGVERLVRKQSTKQRPVPYAPRPQGFAGNKLTPSEAAIHVSEVRREDSGDVIVSFKNTDVLIAQAATGALILNSGGFRTFSTRAILCAALQPVGLKVEGDATKPDDLEANDNWAVSDGIAFLQKFEDGMVIQQVGRLSRHQLLARPSVILQYMQQKKAGLTKKMGRSTRPVNQNGGGALQRSQGITDSTGEVKDDMAVLDGQI